MNMISLKHVQILVKPVRHGRAIQRNPLDAAAPLLDQAEGVEDPADHAIAQLRDAVRQVLHREAEGQEPRVFDLKAVVKYRDAEGSTALRIV